HHSVGGDSVLPSATTSAASAGRSTTRPPAPMSGKVGNADTEATMPAGTVTPFKLIGTVAPTDVPVERRYALVARAGSAVVPLTALSATSAGMGAHVAPFQSSPAPVVKAKVQPPPAACVVPVVCGP